MVENVFYLPGLGRLIFQSISNRDLIVVRNCVMLLAAMVIVVNFVVDLLYAAIDPRIKAADARRQSLTRPPPATRRCAIRASLLGGVLVAARCCWRPRSSLVWTPWPPYEIDMARKLQRALRRRTGSAPTRSAATSSRC